jgi:SAM-dependent methyltransferase
MSDFDRYALSYEEALAKALAVSGETDEYFSRGRVRFLKRCLQRVHARPIDSVLDFGCGVGAGIPALQDEFAARRIVGIDVSSESLNIARRRCLHGAEFHLCDDYVPRQDIDLAFCNGVFHHIVPDARLKAVHLIRRSLRSGGVFALWENNPWSAGARYIMARCEFDRDAIVISAREAVRLITAAGLRVVGVRFFFVFPRMLRHLRWLEPYLARMPLGAQYQVLSVKP